MRLKAKPIPLITWQNMAPPFKDHLYFQHKTRFPFQYDRRQFSLVNAWWLSEAALLSYADTAYAVPRFKAAGFDDVRFFSGQSTQCYVAANRKFAVVAFRGTECGIGRDPEAITHFIADLGVDIDIRWAEARSGGKIHRGFHNALAEIWDDLQPHLNALAGTGRTLWGTGHSLGGALAVAMASRFNAARGIYTFGAPRVGNQKFVSSLQTPLYRVVHNNDVVPHLPPYPYADPGELHYIDRNGGIHSRVDRWERWKDEIQGHLQCLVENVRHLDQSLATTLPDGLKGHTPLLYALHLWNNLISDPKGT